MGEENTTIFCPNVDYLRTEKKRALKSLEGLTLEQADEVVGFLYHTLNRARMSGYATKHLASSINTSVPIIIGKQI